MFCSPARRDYLLSLPNTGFINFFFSYIFSFGVVDVACKYQSTENEGIYSIELELEWQFEYLHSKLTSAVAFFNDPVFIKYN